MVAVQYNQRGGLTLKDRWNAKRMTMGDSCVNYMPDKTFL